MNIGISNTFSLWTEELAKVDSGDYIKLKITSDQQIVHTTVRR